MSLIFPIAESVFIPITAQSIPEFTEITFPLTNEGEGLKIDWNWKGITHELLSYKVAKKHHGYRLIFDFDFTDWAEGATLMKFKTIKNALDAGFRWRLRPRNIAQYATFTYEVFCSTDNFSVQTDSAEQWMKNFHIQFQTVELVPNIDWLLYTPDSTVEYAALLENFATP